MPPSPLYCYSHGVVGVVPPQQLLDGPRPPGQRHPHLLRPAPAHLHQSQLSIVSINQSEHSIVKSQLSIHQAGDEVAGAGDGQHAAQVGADQRHHASRLPGVKLKSLAISYKNIFWYDN